MKTLNIKSLLQLPQEYPILSWINRRWDWSLFLCENLISQSSHWNNFSPWKALMCVSSLDLDGYVFGFEHRVHMKHMWWSRSSGLVKHLKQSRHSNLAIFDELYSTGIKSLSFWGILFLYIFCFWCFSMLSIKKLKNSQNFPLYATLLHIFVT